MKSDIRLCRALPGPPGGAWRELDARDYAVLVPMWCDMQVQVSRSPFWQTWFNVLVNPETGWFDQYFMHVLGLFDAVGTIRCAVVEVENFDQAGASQLMLWVPPSLRGRNLGRYAMRAAIVTARRNGRTILQAECLLSNVAATRLFLRYGMCCVEGNRHDPAYACWYLPLEQSIVSRIRFAFRHRRGKIRLLQTHTQFRKEPLP